MVAANDWHGVELFAKRMMVIASRPAMAKWREAIRRIEAVFQEETGMSPWPPEWPDDRVMERRMRIAALLAGVGSAKPLIDDIREVSRGRHRPTSLSYFLVAEKGARPSRWDLLLEAERERQWAATKRAENEFAQLPETATHPRGTIRYDEPKSADEMSISQLFKKIYEAGQNANHRS